MRTAAIAGLILGLAALGGVAALVFTGSPRDVLLAQAAREGQVVVYGNADERAIAPLIAAFRQRHPGLVVRYHDLQSTRLFERFVAESDAGNAGADLVWSSAMDLQAKLVNDGYARSYASPEAPALPRSAVWKDMAYGVTAEPVGFIYNTRLIAPAEAPTTHRALEQLLRDRREALTGKVATYDPARSNIGYLYLTQDLAITRDTRALLEAIAATRPLLSATTEPMIDAVASGRAAIGYNVVGSYALERARADPSLRVVFPRDYTIVASRVALIARDAPHPAAARLFLDFLLSRPGQVLLGRNGLPPVRTDVPALRLEPEQARPVPGGPQLFVNLDPVKRRRLLAEWHAIMAEGTNK